MLLSEFSYISFLLYSDLDYIKIHAVGDRFDDVQSTAETLAVFAKYTADAAAKKAISLGEEVKAFAKAKQVIDDSVWCPEDKEAYTFDDLIEFLARKGSDYIDAIHETRKEYLDGDDNYRVLEDVRSMLDRVLSFWDEEILYKNSARQYTKEESVIEIEKSPLLDPVDYGRQEMNRVTDVPITMGEWATKFKDRAYTADEIVDEVNKIFGVK